MPDSRKATIKLAAELRAHTHRITVSPYTLVQPPEINAIIYVPIAISLILGGGVLDDVGLWIIPVKFLQKHV
jgi:hypothetical protein